MVMSCNSCADQKLVLRCMRFGAGLPVRMHLQRITWTACTAGRLALPTTRLTSDVRETKCVSAGAQY